MDRLSNLTLTKMLWEMAGGILIVLLLWTQVRSAIESYRKTKAWKSMVDELVKVLGFGAVIVIVFFEGNLGTVFQLPITLVKWIWSDLLVPFLRTFGIPV